MSKMTIRKTKDGKTISISASGLYAREIFNSIVPVNQQIKTDKAKP